MEIVGTFLEWLLGLLSPGIAERIRRRRISRETIPAIAREIEELGLTLALLAWRVRSYQETADATFASWLARYVDEYRGSDQNEPAIKQLHDPARILNDGRAWRRRGPEHGLDLKEYSLSLLNANMAHLASCPPDFCSSVLHLKGQLDLLNADSRAANADARKTFDSSLSSENRAALMVNQMRFYQLIAERAVSMADKAREIATSYRS